jgi:hypothetical protein
VPDGRNPLPSASIRASVLPAWDPPGTHFWLGASLTRLTLRVFFEELAARVESIEALARPVYEANVFVKGVTRFGVALRARRPGPS